MRILVTGGAGFVGSVLVPMLLQAGHKVRVYDSLMWGVDGLLACFLHKNFEFVKGDVRDSGALEKRVEDCAIIVHLAALVGFPICKKFEREALEVNVGGTRTVCGTANKEAPIILASTDSCYGKKTEVCVEALPLDPLTVYGDTKVLAEEAVRERENSIVLRFATGYGVSPRMRLDLMVNDFCYKAVKEKNLVVYEADYRRAFVHVLDMARAILFAIQNIEKMQGEVFNIGSVDLNLTKRQVAEFIKKKVKYYLHYADFGRDEDQRDYEVSSEKIEALGFETTVSLETGVSQLIDLFQSFEPKPQYSNV